MQNIERITVWYSEEFKFYTKGNLYDTVWWWSLLFEWMKQSSVQIHLLTTTLWNVPFCGFCCCFHNSQKSDCLETTSGTLRGALKFYYKLNTLKTSLCQWLVVKNSCIVLVLDNWLTWQCWLCALASWQHRAWGISLYWKGNGSRVRYAKGIPGNAENVPVPPTSEPLAVLWAAKSRRRISFTL